MGLGQGLWNAGVESALHFGLGRWAIWKLGQIYSAGSSIDEGFQAITEHWDQRQWRSTFDIFGEEASTPDEAERYLDSYKEAVRRAARVNESHGPNIVTVSTKPTSICAVQREGVLDPTTPFPDRLEELVDYARQRNVLITQDMEDRHYTTLSLEAGKHIWERGYDNFEIVLQFRLHRTFKDIDRYIRRGRYPIAREAMRVRACIGTYPETPRYAVDDMQAKMRLIIGVGDLFDMGLHVDIATHDPVVVSTLKGMIRDKGVPHDRYEFQFLQGVNMGERLAAQLVDEGHDVRFYMGVELNKYDAVPYFGRRAKENPALMLHYAQNLMQRFEPRAPPPVP